MTRVCSFCYTRQPVSALVQVAVSYQCADRAACDARAAGSGVYPLGEADAAAIQARQGVLR